MSSLELSPSGKSLPSESLSSSATITPSLDCQTDATNNTMGTPAPSSADTSAATDESTEDSVSIRCQLLPTPEGSPTRSPQRDFPLREEGEILEPAGNTIDISTLSLGPIHSSKTPSSALNANASNFIPQSASHPQHYTPPDGAIDLTQATSLGNDYASLTGKTPNVYINGLPPHYPEDQLFQLAAAYGGVRSVRTFTRHIGDRESGYGFVLFDAIDSAERCINSLRRYRNLHPTFSKVHKIPGTQYGTSVSSPAELASLTTSATMAEINHAWDRESLQSFGRAETFKELLADPSSTNLYIEGLPLSIDEPTLAALVSPHHIKSSRFFQTRLSNPPRIIAFVRLDSRLGAEEVRGWNDTGSRISVRFADTCEQRELRRTERILPYGEGSPGRLTIAQAALLNLRGQDQITSVLPGSRSMSSVPTQTLPPIIGSQSQNQLNLLPLIPNRRPIIGSGSYGNIITTSSSLGDFSTNHASLGDYPFNTHEQAREISTFVSSHAPHSTGFAQKEVDTAGYPSQPRSTNAVQARNGYTPTEEYILQAHVAQQRKAGGGIPLIAGRSKNSGGSIGMGMRGIRTHGQVLSPSTSTQSFDSPRTGLSMEDEFHAKHGRKPKSVDYGFSSNGARLEEPKRSPFQTYLPTPQLPANPRMTGLQSHIRSTTLPHPSSGVATTHGKRNSISTAGQGCDGDGLRLGFASDHNSAFSSNKHVHYSNNNDHQHDNHNEHRNDSQDHNRRNTNLSKMHIDTRSHHNYELNQLIDGSRSQEVSASPTLTYASRTPSTLSPSTPQFFGTFAGNGGADFGAASDGRDDRAVSNLKGEVERKRANGQQDRRDVRVVE
ncbi:hypothetical protein DL96DRAFT_1714496 [Flagelloscypha sp. PMI_526]|nr:hypothetical protein DL96DRAFT_1714496 [Flagelloscypha sp. PMI_526]